jgi:hypothetical protein
MATRLMLNIVSGPFVAWGLGACDHPNPTSWTFAAGYRGRDQRWGTAVDDDDVVDGRGLSIRFMLSGRRFGSADVVLSSAVASASVALSVDLHGLTDSAESVPTWWVFR